MYSPAKLFYVWGHSYEFDQNDNWDHMEKLLDKVAFKDDVWYATNGQIQSYVDAYRKLIFSVDSTKFLTRHAQAYGLVEFSRRKQLK